MRTLNIIAVAFALLVGVTANAQQYKRVGDTIVKVEQTKTKEQPVDTGLTFKTKDATYPVYKSSKGSYFVIRVSKKTGKEYKQYIKLED